MKNKKVFVLFCLWGLFIFSNSCLPATDSSEVSQGLSYQIYMFLNLHVDFDLFHALIRKCAHFVEYTILGILAYGSFKNRKVALFIGVLVACFDETIQLFVDGRSGQISDVVLDSLGVLVGNISCTLLSKLHFIHKDRKNDEKGID